MCVAPDGVLIASGGNDRKVTMWNLQSKEVVRTLEIEGWVRSVSIAATGNLMAAAGAPPYILVSQTPSDCCDHSHMAAADNPPT